MGISTIPRSFAVRGNMVFTTVQHNKAQGDRALHDMNSTPADAYTLRGSTYPYQFASQSNTSSNKLQHNTNPTPTYAFQAAAQSTNAQPIQPPPLANPPTTKIEFLQNGTLRTIMLPIACSAREIVSLQEYAMNTQCGKTNFSTRRGAYINNVGDRLNAYCAQLEKAEKIQGGVFDGLSRQEAEWLREMGWRE